MSMRARIVLIGLLAFGQSVAQATAPQIVDPRDDLFEPPSRLAAPKASEAPPPKPDRSPAAMREPTAAANPDSGKGAAEAAPGAARELPANPLWAIPFSQLTAMRDRPPFSPSRRPPQPAAVAKPVQQAAPPPKPPEPVTPQLSLVGTIVGAGGGVGLFVNTADKSTVRLKLGDNHKGWVLRAVASHQVELANGLDSAVLKLPLPDMKPVAGAPPPLHVAPPGMPPPGTPQAATPQATTPPGMPVPAYVVNVSQPAADAQRAATNAIQPPVFEQPQPTANPFRFPDKGVAR
jgi:general secretion pathway protein N